MNVQEGHQFSQEGNLPETAPMTLAEFLESDLEGYEKDFLVRWRHFLNKEQINAMDERQRITIMGLVFRHFVTTLRGFDRPFHQKWLAGCTAGLRWYLVSALVV